MSSIDKTLLHKFRSQLQPNIHAIGLQSARFQSALLIDSHLLLPLGCSLSVWDIQQIVRNIISSNKRLVLLQTNTNAIYSIIANEKYIYSIAYNGEVAILDKKSYSLVKRLNEHLGHENRYVSLNTTHFAITAEATSSKSINRGCVHIYDLEGNQVWQLHGRYRFAQLFDSCLVVVHERKIEIQDKQSLQPKTLQQMKNSRKYKNTLQVFMFGEEIPITTIELGWDPSEIIVAAKTEEPYHIAAFISSDRKVIIYDADLRKIIYNGRFEGAGAIMSASFTGAYLILNSIKNNITRIKCDTDLQELPSLIQNQSYPPMLTFDTIKSCLEVKPQYIKEFKQSQYLIINEEGCYVIEQGELQFKRLFGGITFCGVGVNQDLKYVFAGDFLGNVHGFHKNTLGIEHEYQTNTGLPIRSLLHLIDQSALIYGTVDGSLFFWNYIDEPRFIASLGGSITILRQKDHCNKQIILASTTDGYITIFQMNEENQFTQLVSHHAHKPQQDHDSEKFGQLDLRAEVWSTCFHPNDATLIATCSEDQNIHIYSNSLQQPQLSKVLKGHKLAVTSVDWQQMRQGIVLASCSDDQTIRFYDEKLDLIKEITTSWIQEWHTLTYLALQKDGDLVVIGAQNGYLFIYSLALNEFIFAEKIHLGGIEGLVWKDNIVCTCSSDNILNVLTIDNA